MATESRRIRRDAFIKSVRPDPKSTEELVLLQGYIGDSDLMGHVRVYSDAALSDFIDLPEQDICYADPIEPAEDPLGGSRLWVKKTTVFTAGDPAYANRVKSSFLEGDLIQAFGDVRNIPTATLGIAAPPSIQITCLPIRCPLPTTTRRTIHQPCFSIPGPCLTINNPSCRPNGPCRSLQSPCITVQGRTCPVFDCCVVGTRGCGLLTRTCFGQTLCIGGTRTCVGGTIDCFGGTIQCAGGTIQCGGGTIQCGGGTLYETFQTDVVVNPAAQQQFATQTYTGGFDPYQTANLGY